VEFSECLGNEFSTNLADSFMEFGFRSAFVCVYRRPVCIADAGEFSVPDRADIVFGYNAATGYKDSFASIFYPKKRLVPGSFFNSGTGYLVYPIYSGRYMNGYIVCESNSADYYYSILFLQFAAKIVNIRVLYRTQQLEAARLLNEKQVLEKNNENLSRLSRTDSMTELLNRRGLMEYGQQVIDAAVEVKNSGMVIFADMDGLKSINDRYGHDAGDSAIRAEAKILKQVFRTSDVIARIGGDEFAVVSVGMDRNVFERIEKYMELLTSEWNVHEKVPFRLSISMGGVLFYRGKSVLGDLLKQADFEQYAIKRKKKNRILFQ
jgi:diguanylate cyclase (GGDEF)-like protein